MDRVVSWKRFSHTYLKISIDKEALNSAITGIQEIKYDVQNFIKHLEHNVSEKIEDISHTCCGNGVLNYAIWLFKECKEIMSKFAEVVFLDSSVRMTKYVIKLLVATILD